jgi:thioesterase domain-containing protein
MLAVRWCARATTTDGYTMGTEAMDRHTDARAMEPRAMGKHDNDDAQLDAWFAAMPPVAAMGIRSAGHDGEVLRLVAPLDANVNDKACAFGGSLASIMTLACWGWLMLRVRATGATTDVYVADSQLRYLLPLYGDLHAEVRLAEGQDWSAIVRSLGERGRARATMRARVIGADGAVAATMDARFALMGS